MSSFAIGTWLEAHSVIDQRELHTARCSAQFDLDMGRMGVLTDVGERLLCYPKQF